MLLAALLATLAACGGHHADPAAGYLTLVHQPLAGTLAHAPDQQLLALGHQACHDLDGGAAPDGVVADIGGNPEPGSAAYNSYSFVAVAAADDLCPRHRSAFGGSLSQLGG